jgi:hypothetical protein
MLNAKEGECFAESGESVARVDCTDPKAAFQVAKVLDGSTDAAGCPEGSQGIVYPEPKPGLVYCIGAAAGTTTG